MKEILKIGITGGIGTGKTLILKIFSLLGVPVYNADERAKWLMMNEPEVIENIKKEFGKESYLKNNLLNTAYLSTKVFNDNNKLTKLNDIVHPEVAKDFRHWLENLSPCEYIVKEAALLFESGSYKTLDKIIVISSPISLRMERILKRDKQRREKDVLAIIGKQMREEEKIKKADFVIYNNNEKMLIPQIIKLHEKFISGF